MRLPYLIERLESAAWWKAPVVLGFCFLLPDLIDKPLWVVGIGMGRFVGHTLLFVLLVAAVFFTAKKSWGILALLGGLSHLLSDAETFMPWLYPFVSYRFPKLEFWGFVEWRMVALLLGQLAVVVIVTTIIALAGQRLKGYSAGTGAGRPPASGHQPRSNGKDP